MWVDRRVHAMEIYFVAMAYEMSDPFGDVPLCCSTTHFNLTLQTSTRKTDEHRTKYDNQTISVFRSFFFSLAFIALWVMWTSLTHTWQIFEGCCMSFELFFFRGRTLNMNISIYINYTRKTVFNIRRVLDEELNHIQTESEKKLPTQAHVSIRLVVGGQCRKPREGERDENAKWRLYGRY